MSNPRDTKQAVATLLGVGGLVALAIAFAQFGSVGRTKQYVGKVKAQPQKITADELGRRGPGDNLYVQVTDLQFGEDTLTIRSSKGGRWSSVFMPVHPKGQKLDGRPPLILVHSSSIGNADELRSFCNRSSVVGIVTNPLEGVSHHADKFKEKYPRFDGKDIWVVDVSREVPTASKAESGYLTACVLVCVGLGLFGGCGWVAYQMTQETQARAAAVRSYEDDVRLAVRPPGPPPEVEKSASELASRFDPRRR